MNQIVGLDLSLNNTGISICGVEDEFSLRHLSNLKLKAEVKGVKVFFERRVELLIEQLVFLEVFSPRTSLVFVEGFAMRGSRMTEIAMHQGIVRYHLYKSGNIPVRAVAPQTLKKHATGGGHAEKSAVVVHSNRKYRDALARLGIDILTENNQADALNLCHMAWQYYNVKQGGPCSKEFKHVVNLIDKQDADFSD